MVDTFEAYCKELSQGDLDPKTIARYWQIVTSYRKWLGYRQPDILSAKEFLAKLKENGYCSSSILLYYHALRRFFNLLGIVLKVRPRWSNSERWH